MKFINSVHGTVVLHVSADDVVPRQGLIIPDLINFLRDNYHFAVVPQVPAGVPPSAMSTLVFQSGTMITGDDKIAIGQLGILTNGDVVTASTTDVADKIIDDYTAKLDEAFGYRYASAEKRKTYISNIVVEFDTPFEKQIKSIVTIENILAREISRPAPFKMKRLAFGYGDVTLQPTVDVLDSLDFVVERRAGEPYSKNRYFSAAPTRTSQHVRILEMIEKELNK